VAEIIDNDFLQNVGSILEQAKKHAQTAINLTMVYAYFEIGKAIVEEEMQGKDRADYGKRVIKTLSDYLTDKYGKGYSVGNLKNIRQFYSVYSKDQIGETVFSQSSNLPVTSTGRRFYLSWSHYLKLMRIEDVDARHFYEIEAARNGWSLSELKRQCDSSLYERLLLSTDKDKVKELAKKGQIIEKPSDLVKDPYVLEFLGLQEQPEYSESELETKIINHMQEFLLELGKGFTFVGRQKRFTFSENHYFVDLVFYNRLLRCFVLIDLKCRELRHEDLGQMQMYVNYYDRYEKTEDENPTVGILLCSDKDDSMVELTLPENSNIYASKYALYLPDKKLLQEKLREWSSDETN
jgi:predicted nuclease of restriction endonuclease-like (RecB) superfamily